MFDKNGDGFIDPEELRSTMTELGVTLSEQDLSLMIKEAQCHIPGRIYYEEFVRIMFSQVLKPIPVSQVIQTINRSSNPYPCYR